MLYITTTRNATNRMCTQCTDYQASGQAGICSHGLHSKLRDLANSEQLSATGPVMAGRVLSAAVGSLLVLMALLTAVLKCQCSRSVPVIPNSYEIDSAAVYVDPACSPSSSNERVTQNNTLPVVHCFPKQATGATPRLTDGVLGPDNLHSPTTDFAYTLAGPSQFGRFETWIKFEFASRVSLANITLHYYCTGQSPQLQLSDGSGVVAPPVSPPCDSTAQIQCMTISINTSTRMVILEVLRNNNTIYISEIKFFTDQSPNAGVCCLRSHTNTPTTDSRTSAMEMPTPSHNQPGTLSADGITSTLPHTGQTTAMATPKTSPTDSTSATRFPSNNSSAVAGAVSGVVAGLVVCIAVAVLLIIACSIFKRRRNINTKLSERDNRLGPEKYTSSSAYQTTAEGKVSPKHPEMTYTTLHNPLYKTGKGPNEPTDNHYSAVAGPCYTAVNGPHYDAVKKDSRASPPTGQSTHPNSPVAYYEIEASTDTYSVPFGPDSDTYTVPVDATNLKPLAPKRSNSLDRSANFASQNGEISIAASDFDHTYSAVGQKAMEPGRLSPGTNRNDGTYSQAVPVRCVRYTRNGSKKVPPKDIGKEPTQMQEGRQVEDRAAMELEGGGSEKSDAITGAVYAVVDKKRKEEERAMAASEIREFELEKSAATAGAVYTVLDKIKKAPPPLPLPYQLGD